MAFLLPMLLLLLVILIFRLISLFLSLKLLLPLLLLHELSLFDFVQIQVHLAIDLIMFLLKFLRFLLISFYIQRSDLRMKYLSHNFSYLEHLYNLLPYLDLFLFQTSLNYIILKTFHFLPATSFALLHLYLLKQIHIFPLCLSRNQN